LWQVKQSSLKGDKMRNIAGIFSLLVVLVVAQGCATANEYRAAIHTRSMEQMIERNNIALSSACSRERIRSIIAAKYEAAQNGTASWSTYYVAPSCVLNEQNTWKRKQAVIPREFGFTLADLAKLDYDELCEKSPLKRMGTSRGMVWLAEDKGIPSEFYENISQECIRRDREETNRSFVWNNLFYRLSPQIGYGYGHGYGNYRYRRYEGGAPMGKTRRALVKRVTGH
jgi:hypothetical protein